MEKNILEYLQCPMCRGTLQFDQQDTSSASREERYNCTDCERWYPVFQGTPMMLPEHSSNLKAEKLEKGFINPPGLAPKKSKFLAWYYNRPIFAGGIEEGEWKDFNYKDVEGKVLDIGAGDRHIVESLGNVKEYISIDIIPRDRPTVVADAHHLPFRDGTFDVVIARALLEHVEDEQMVVAEASRVLRPGGLFLFSAPFLYPIHDSVDHHRFTIYSLRSLAERHELEIMRLTSSGGYFGVLADHVHHGLKMEREYIDRRFGKKNFTRKFLRFFVDLAGMIIYLPFHILNKLDSKLRRLAKLQQGRIPFVVSYSGVFRKKE